MVFIRLQCVVITFFFLIRGAMPQVQSHVLISRKILYSMEVSVHCYKNFIFVLSSAPHYTTLSSTLHYTHSYKLLLPIYHYPMFYFRSYKKINLSISFIPFSVNKTKQKVQTVMFLYPVLDHKICNIKFLFLEFH